MRLSHSALALCSLLIALPTAARAQHAHGHHGAPDSTALVMGAMTVRATREPMLLRSGRTIIDPRAIAASNGSITDLLRVIPGVDISADGKVSLRGNAHALVMINGRRTALSGEALVAYLRQMPAQSLERIEAATVPSAKQDANGAAGVLNLVFREAEDAEHTSPLRSATVNFASRDDFAATAAATGHAGQFVHWNAAYSLSANQPRTRADVARWTALPGDLPYTTTEDARSEATHQLHSVIAGATVTPTPTTSFGLRGNYSWMKGATSLQRAAAYRDEAGNTASSSTASDVEHVMPTGELIGTASVTRGRARFASEMRGSFVRGDYSGDYDDVGGGFRYLSATMNSRQREQVVRNDLRLRWSGADVEVGHEWRTRSATAVHDAVHFSDAETRAFRHESDVHAGYLSVVRGGSVFRGEAGVRVEGERDVVALDSVSSRRTVRAFPSLSGEWTDTNRGLVYRVAYGRRLTRPSWEMLNPLGMGDEAFGEFVGNERLRAEVVDQVEVGVERRGARASVQMTPFLRWSTDPIRQISTATSRGVSRSLENAEWARSAGADVGLNARLTERVDMTLGGTVAKVTTRRDSELHDGVQTALRVALSVRVSEHTTAQLLLAGHGRQTIEQAEALPQGAAQLALKQSVARGRGSVTVQLNSSAQTSRQVLWDPGTLSNRVSQFSLQPALRIFASFGVGGTMRER